MTLLLLVGYVPLVILALGAGMVLSSRRNESASARALGDRVGRRSGADRRSGEQLPFVGADRRSGADRRAAGAAEDRRVA